MPNAFDRMAGRMDASSMKMMGETITINGTAYIAIESHLLAEMGPLNGDGISLVVFTEEYIPRRNDVVSFKGASYQVTQHRLFNRKPQIWIE